MLGCSSLLPTEIAFLIHYSSFKSLLAVTVGDGWLMQLRSCLAFFGTTPSLINDATEVCIVTFFPHDLVCFKRCDFPVLAESNFNNASHVMHLTALTFLLSLSTICMKEVQTEEVPLDFTSLYSFCLSFFSHHSWRNPWSPTVRLY